MQITIIEGHQSLGWTEIGFYGVEDLKFLNQLMWRAGEHISLVYTGDTTFSLVPMPMEIRQGKSPAIRIFERSWNDESTAVDITMKSPTGVSNGSV